MVTYTVYMKEGALWQDITHAVVAEETIPLRMGFSSLQDSQDVGNITLTLHMESLEAAALIGTERKQVRILANSSPIFEGVTYEDSRVDLRERSDLIYTTVKLKPYSALFSEVKVEEDTIWIDKPILTSSVDSLIPSLFYLLNPDLVISTDVEIDKELPIVKLERGESVEDYLTEVLYQQGLSYYTNVDVVYIVEPYKARSGAWTLPLKEIVSRPKIQQSPYVIEERCVVRLPKVEQHGREVIYELNTDRYEDTGQPTEVAVIESEDYYPKDDDEPTLLDIDYSDREEAELVHAEGLEIDVTTYTYDEHDPKKVGIDISELELGADSATVQLYNPLGDFVSLRNIRIIAEKAWYYNWNTYYEDAEAVGDTDEIDGLYMVDSQDAKNFINRYRAEKDAERTSVEFTTHHAIEPNTLVEIEGLPYQLLVRYRTQEGEWYKYSTVAYKLHDVPTTGRVRVIPREGARDGYSPQAVTLYALGDMDAPYDEHDRVADTESILADQFFIVGTGSPWSETPPIAGEGEYIWAITGYYTPPQMYPTSWTTPLRVTGEGAKVIRLFANPSAIKKSFREEYEHTTVSVTAQTQNLSGAITWHVSDGEWTLISETEIEIDALTVEDERVIVTAQVGDFASSVAIEVIVSGGDTPHNFGGIKYIPETAPDGGALLEGDYFLWADETKTIDGKEYEKAEAYVWDKTGWNKTADGDLIMSLLDSYDKLEDDNETVLAFQVIKRLVSTNAFIQNLVAENLQAGAGTGLAGSGVRFRAKSDKYGDGMSNPVFDVMFGDKKLFEIDPIVGNVDIGDYEGGNGARWDNSTGKFYVSGHIDADSGTVRGQLDTVTLETVLGGDTQYPKGNFTSNETLVTMLGGEFPSATTLTASGAINSKNIKSVRYGAINVQSIQRYKEAKYLGSTYYKTYSVLVCTVTTTFTMSDDSTITYVLRKIYGNSRHGSTLVYPAYPSPPSSHSDLASRNNYVLPDPNPDSVVSHISESAFNDILPLRSFPYNIISLSLWDSTSERLFIKNLPSSAPSESGRVWNDNGTLKIVT